MPQDSACGLWHRLAEEGRAHRGSLSVLWPHLGGPELSFGQSPGSPELLVLVVTSMGQPVTLLAATTSLVPRAEGHLEVLRITHGEAEAQRG